MGGRTTKTVVMLGENQKQNFDFTSSPPQAQNLAQNLHVEGQDPKCKCDGFQEGVATPSKSWQPFFFNPSRGTRPLVILLNGDQYGPLSVSRNTFAGSSHGRLSWPPDLIINQGSVQGAAIWWKRRLSGEIKPLYHSVIVVSLSRSLFHSSAPPILINCPPPPHPSATHPRPCPTPSLLIISFEVVNVSDCGVLFHRVGRLMSWYKSALKSVYFSSALLFLQHTSLLAGWYAAGFSYLLWLQMKARRGGGKKKEGEKTNTTKVCERCRWCHMWTTAGGGRLRRVESVESFLGGMQAGRFNQHALNIQRQSGWSRIIPSISHFFFCLASVLRQNLKMCWTSA